MFRSYSDIKFEYLQSVLRLLVVLLFLPFVGHIRHNGLHFIDSVTHLYPNDGV